ncbi:trithorax group protein osa-like isoform X3 [Palaemon carinicauda]|uniref:trithorax group protein osa-like isoform X3 n=1 Tax=Palaemon carinicauda TaxID=392227 RepID=UPI0035B5A823
MGQYADQQQMGLSHHAQYPGQMGHMGQGMPGQGHPGHDGPPGREGDPYSFVDEYSGPPPRPVEEILGQTQPKRRGRKPKHIKLMENGSMMGFGDGLGCGAAAGRVFDTPESHYPSGDPLAIAAAQAAHEAKKRKWKQLGPDGKPILAPMKQRKKVDRFDGISEEDVAKKTLPDHLAPNLDIVIIGINPGLFAAYKGHHYAGPGNHFSSCNNQGFEEDKNNYSVTRRSDVYQLPIGKCLYLSGLIPEPLTSEDDFRLLEHGIGFTNIVARTTRGSADLTRKEIKEGGQILLSKLQRFQPRIAVFNGKGIYEIFSGKKEFTFGRQPEKIEGTRTHVWVMPSSSARCAQLPRALDKVPFYTALRKFRDFIKGTLDELNEEEITFVNGKAKSFKTEVCEKMELGCEGQPGELCPPPDMCQPRDLIPPRDMCPPPPDHRESPHIGEELLSIKEEPDVSTKLSDDMEEDDLSKEMPRTLYNLNGMTREQLEGLDCPTIPIRKKRGRPKKTPDDPNAPPRPRPRPQNFDPLMCNGEEPIKKKRGRPKKVLEDGTIPPPKKPGRKPRALKEMLLAQQQQQPGPVHQPHQPHQTHPHHPHHLQQQSLSQQQQLSQQQPLGQQSSLTQQPPLSQQPPPPQSVGMSHMNGMMSPRGFSPNPGAQTFSPQYGGHTPVHGGGSLTPNHNTGNQTPGHTAAMVPRGPTPQQFGQSPGYSPGPVNNQPPQRTTPYSQQADTPTDLKVEEDHHLLTSPPASPIMAQPDFEPPSSMPEGDMSIGASDTQSSTALTPSHQHQEDGKASVPLTSRDQPQLTPTMPGQFSNPTTPVDGSSYQNYPSYPSNASHSPSMVKPPIHPGQSPTVTNKGDVASKSLSGLESLVDQIPSLNEHETSSQHSAHSNSAPCSNPTTPGPPTGSAPFSPGHVPPTSTYQSYPGGSSSGASAYPTSHYGSPQSSHPYSPHYSSNSTNLSTNFSVSSLANSSISTTMSYSSAYDLGSPQASTSSFSVSSLTSSAPAPSPSMYSTSYSPAPPPTAPGPPPPHSSYPDIMSPSMLAATPPMGSSFMGSPSLMSSPTPMSSSMSGSSMGPMGALHSSMGMTYPYSQYSDATPSYPPPGHSTFPYPPTTPGFHVPSPRFPYPSPYANSPYTQGYSQNAMLERIKQTSMGMGFGGF